jgi:hypothetical protein
MPSRSESVTSIRSLRAGRPRFSVSTRWLPIAAQSLTYAWRFTFSIAFPFASSSISLSR